MPHPGQITSHSLLEPVRGVIETTDDSVHSHLSFTPRHLANASSAPTTMNPGPIAAITVGSLVALLILFLIFGTIVNRCYTRRRAEQTRLIEAQHRRWPDLEASYPPSDFLEYPRPYYPMNIEKPSFNTYQARQAPVEEEEVVPEKIGIAISPDVGTMESPESYRSESSGANLLPSPKHAVASSTASHPVVSSNAPSQKPKTQKTRPESTFTVFDEDDEVVQTATVFNQTPVAVATNNPFFDAKEAAVAPQGFRAAPAKLQIPQSRLAPPPIIISPPRAPSKSSTAKPTYRRPAEISRVNTPPSNASTTLPNYSAFPAPPQYTAAPTRNPTLLKPPPNLRKTLPPVQQESSRKPTPSYLPTYYTDPTPPAPVPLTPRSPYERPQPRTPTKNADPTPKQDEPTPKPARASDSSQSTATSFESTKSEDLTPPEEESSYTKPLPVSPESPLTDFRYPKIPRPSNQRVPRSPPSRHTPGHSPGHSRNTSNLSNGTSRSAGSSSLAEKRRGPQVASDLESGLRIQPPNARLRLPAGVPIGAVPGGVQYHGGPSFNQAGQSETAWPQRQSSRVGRGPTGQARQ